MAEVRHIIKNINNVNYLLNNNRVFFPSKNVNVFPCSRRGSINTYIGAIAEKGSSKICYDPEARLNTERTNRISTAINGFTDSFIISNDDFTAGNTLEFVLKGYRIEVKNFEPLHIAEVLGITDGTIYAHLSLHGNISLNVPDYYTEILYRQSDVTRYVLDKNYLDVSYAYEGTDVNNISIKKYSDDFFVGISFTSNEDANDAGVTPYFLPLFSKTVNSDWELVQTSLLPKVEHDTTPNSTKLSGDFTVKHGEQTSFKVTENKTTLGPTEISELDVTGDFTVKQVSGEGEEISFEITKHGAGTVNVPLHITKATTVDGMANLSATSIQSLIVGEKAEDDIYDNGIIKAKKHIETPTLETTESIKTPVIDVKTLENTQDDTGVSINDNLNVIANHTVAADTMNVNTVNSRQENGKITVESPVVLNGKATLNNGLEVAIGDATIKSNLKVEDNINVGTPATPATADNGGYIVAKKDITAEQDLIAKRDITVTKKATVESLVVGERADTDSTEAGVIIAKNLVKTPTLEATTKVKTPELEVNTITSEQTEIVVDKTLKVDKTLDVTGETTLAGKTTVSNNLSVTGTIETPKLTVNTATIQQTLNVKKAEDAEDPAEANIDKATIEELKVTSSTTMQGPVTIEDTVTADNLTVTASGMVDTPAIKTDTISSKSGGVLTVSSDANITGATSLQNLSVSNNATVTGTITSYSLKTGAAEAASLKVTGQSDLGTVSTKKIEANELWLDTVDNKTIGQVPALELAHLTKTNTYQLRFKFGTPITITEE